MNSAIPRYKVDRHLLFAFAVLVVLHLFLGALWGVLLLWRVVFLAMRLYVGLMGFEEISDFGFFSTGILAYLIIKLSTC